jgi:hypothetical protein
MISVLVTHCTVVFINQLVLHVGELKALAWLRAYAHATSSLSGASKISTCVLLHSTLHSPAFLSQIEVWEGTDVAIATVCQPCWWMTYQFYYV